MPLRQRQEVQEVLRRPGGSVNLTTNEPPRPSQGGAGGRPMLDDLIRDINTLREKVAELGGHL